MPSDVIPLSELPRRVVSTLGTLVFHFRNLDPGDGSDYIPIPQLPRRLIQVLGRCVFHLRRLDTAIVGDGATDDYIPRWQLPSNLIQTLGISLYHLRAMDDTEGGGSDIIPDEDLPASAIEVAGIILFHLRRMDDDIVGGGSGDDDLTPLPQSEIEVAGMMAYHLRRIDDAGGFVQRITNAEKLALPRSTPVGSRYFITDLSPTPAIQELQAPSSAIGGMFVSGAGTTTVIGIYTVRGTFGGKPYYNILGFADNNFAACVVWRSNEWRILSDAGDRMYYSTENVATPNLVTTWVADVGANPVPAVASVTEGELAAGVDVEGAGTEFANSAYIRDGEAFGFLQWRILGGGENYINLNDVPGSGAWRIYLDEYSGTEYSAPLLAAVPWDAGTWAVASGVPPAPTLHRNNVCAEANWLTV